MTYIKTLTAPLIIIAGLALLTACGGGATPDEETAVDCTETPFDSPDMCEDEKDTICQTYGTGDKGHASCDDRINTACVANPFVYDGCDTLDDAIRDNFCALPANIFTHAECMNVSNINDLRMTYCSVTDIFHATCLDNTYGGDGKRDTECRTHGITEPKGHASCDDRINTACVANPFVYDGCDTLDDTIRDNFCKMRVNIFDHAECMDLGNINDLRDTYCSVTEIFHPRCLNDDYDGGDKRDDACQTHGTNVGAGGHASCDGRIRTACTGNPFVYKGCDTLDTDDEKIRDDFCKMEQHIFTHTKCMDIDNINDIRNTYCSVTDIFHASCIDDDYDGDDARDNACLGSPAGVPVHPSCANRPEVIQTCTDDPFLVTNPRNTGCENLDTIVSIREVYCGTSANFAGRCTVNYDDWKDSFGTDNEPPTRPTTTGAQQNEFLNAGINALGDAVTAFAEQIEAMRTVEPDTLDFSGSISGSATANSVSYFSVNGSSASIRYYYAGLDSRADLGAPSFQETGTATWVGKFQVLIGADDALAVQDFELTVNFETSTITSLVKQGITDNYFYLKGDYDSNGVIDGTVNYTELSAAITEGDRTTIMNDAEPEGILTGLIGRQGAIGAFLSGTGDKDNITGGTSATAGFAGGFFADPFKGNVSYSDWVSSSSPPATPAAAPPSGNLNQFVQTIRNDVIKAAHVGQNFNVNLGSLDGDPADGFSVYHITATDDYLVGLSATTSLGVVLNAQPVGTWLGSFVAYEGGVATTTPFELTVDFAGLNINTTVTGTDYTFTATSFGSNDGVIRGTVNRGQITGSLAGLIGAEGAVGVFHSDNNLPDSSFAGGFVAAFVPDVTYAAWLDSFGASPPPATRAAANPGTNVFGGFLNLADGVRDISPTSPTSLTAPNSNRHLTLDGNGTNGDHGVTYLSGRNGTNQQAFVAVLPTTNLGAPLIAQPTIGRWPGKYYNRSLVRDEPTTFEIKFGEKTITSRKTFNAGLSDITTIFALNFTETGVITGNVTEGADTATARGLIGDAGLVGVFVNATPNLPDGSGILYGGFIADNPNN